jgi:hypothetical protein
MRKAAMPAFRRFGEASDLGLDLTSQERPLAMTELLTSCTSPPLTTEAVWDLSVGQRTGLLLALAAADGLEEIDAELRCARCRETLEVTFAINELLDAARTADCPQVEVAGRAFRLPTGRDQLSWMRQAWGSEREAHLMMASSLALDGKPVDAGLLPAIEAALDQADPLLRAPVEAACSECAHSAEYEIDLAAFALDRFRRVQERLIESVHVLASRYHWSEADILGMPEWRRERYLALVAREVR